MGKTTLAFQFACWLSTIDDSKVLLCDVDHQSSLSITCMGDAAWEQAVASHRTIDEIFKHMTTEGAPIPGTGIIHHPLPPLGTLYPNLDVVPSALSLDETEIDLTASSMGNPIESEWRKRTLICEWLEQNKIDKKYNYIIFDCPPATKIVTQNALAASHGYIVPVIPDAVSVRGTPHLTNQMLGKIENQFTTLSDFLPTKGKAVVSTFVRHRKLVGIVVFRIKPAGSYSGWTNDATQHLRSIQRIYHSGEIIEPLIKEGVGVSESNTARLPVYEFPRRQNIGGQGFPKVFTDVSKELKRKIDAL